LIELMSNGVASISRQRLGRDVSGVPHGEIAIDPRAQARNNIEAVEAFFGFSTLGAPK
jgi:hypothetical protein